MSFSEAKETYESLLCDYTECEIEDITHWVNEFHRNFEEGDTNEIKIGQLLEEYPLLYRTHTAKYEKEEGDYSIKKKKIEITLVYDPDKSCYLVVDGNHRVNTFFEEDPSWDCIIREVVSTIPEDLFQYKLNINDHKY